MIISPRRSAAIKKAAAKLGLHTEFQFPVGHITLLTLSSAKLDKASAAGRYVQAGVNLQPATESGLEMCPYSHGCYCRAVCLRTAGRNVFRGGWNARQWRTVLYWTRPALFIKLLIKELDNFEARARKDGLTPVIRADLLSDTSLGARIAAARPWLICSDYTKSPDKAWEALQDLPNYHVCLSYRGDNWVDCAEILDAGGSVSVVFRGELPATFRGFPVVSGDKHDFFFLGPKGVIWGLVAKGAATVSPLNSFVQEMVEV